MARILSVHQEMPDQTFGARKRVYHLAQALVRAGHELHMIIWTTESELAGLAALEAMGITCYPVLAPPSAPVIAGKRGKMRLLLKATSLGRELLAIKNGLVRSRLLIGWICDWRSSVERLGWLEPFKVRLDAVMEQHQFDVVVIEQETNASLIKHLPTGVKTLLSAYDVLSSVLQRECREHSRPRGGALARLHDRFDIEKLKRLERQSLERYDAIVVVSELDAQRWRATAPPGVANRISVVENGVDVHAYQSLKPPPGRYRVVFTGKMDYEPNAEGMRWFLRRVWPLVLHSCPSAQLDIVGTNPPPHLRRLAALFTPGVNVTGWVPSVQRYIEDSDVFVSPLHLGGGTRLKILEAAAMRRPIVATTMACEGLRGLRDGQAVLLRDNPAAFAEAIVRLLADPTEGARLAGAARQVVEQHYDWQILGCKLDAIVRRLVRPGPPDA